MNIVKVLAVTAAVSCATLVSAQEPMQPSGIVQAMLSNDEKSFFETAASADMFEIQASKLAQINATDPALKDYAAMMIKDHTMASEKLKALAISKNVTLPTALISRHRMMFDDLADEKPGKDFDDSYRNKMVMSHKEAVSLFDQTAKKAKDPDIKQYAAMALPKLQEHGGMASALKKKS